MPSPADAAASSLCIFGDSHLASLKQALDQGLLDPAGANVEFWGAYGPCFRQLRYREGAICPEGEAVDLVRQVNGRGREELHGTDFDSYLFYGARLRLPDFMPAMLNILCDPDAHVSAAVSERLTRRFLNSCRAYRFACAFVREAGARVMFAPAPLFTEGVKDAAPGLEHALRAGPEERAAVREWLDDAAARDGITLIHQPDHTITSGYFTRAEYAVEDAGSSGDAVHKNPRFAALLAGAAISAPARAAARDAA